MVVNIGNADVLTLSTEGKPHADRGRGSGRETTAWSS